MKKMNRILSALILAAMMLPASASVQAAPAEAKAAVKAPVNLNQATAEELMTLKGIGPKTAERIIAYRQEQGPFQTIDQIVMVKGIGNAKFENLKDKITV